MSKKINIKVCLYWISVVGPLYDIAVGLVKGISSAFSTAKEEVRLLNLEKMKEDFKNDNE